MEYKTAPLYKYLLVFLSIFMFLKHNPSIKAEDYLLVALAFIVIIIISDFYFINKHTRIVNLDEYFDETIGEDDDEEVIKILNEELEDDDENKDCEDDDEEDLDKDLKERKPIRKQQIKRRKDTNYKKKKGHNRTSSVVRRRRIVQPRIDRQIRNHDYELNNNYYANHSESDTQALIHNSYNTTPHYENNPALNTGFAEIPDMTPRPDSYGDYAAF